MTDRSTRKLATAVSTLDVEAGGGLPMGAFVALIRLQMKRNDIKDERFFEEVHP